MATLPQVDTAIRRLEPAPGQSQTSYFDERTPGLALIVGKKAKSWSLTYTAPGGRRKRISFGRYPAVSLATARNRAQAVFRTLHDDVDPASKRRAYNEAPTVAEAGEDYLRLYASKKATRRFDEDIIRKEVAPRLGDKKLVDIGRADIQTVLRAIQDRGAGVKANRALQVIRKFLSWSVEQGWIDANPSLGISRPVVERPRSRVLSDDELKAFWTALPKVSRQAQACFKLLLLTGQREMEVVGMRWPEIDLERGLWTLPADDPGRSKARALPHVVPLTPAAVAVLSELKGAVSVRSRPGPGGRTNGIPTKAFGDFVFRGRHRDGSPAKPTRSMLVGAKETLDRELGFSEPWRIHDLRRTVRTGLSQQSVPPHIAELVIGHSIRGVIKVYDRYDYLSERREALTRWADHLLTLVGEKECASNVVTLEGARA